MFIKKDFKGMKAYYNWVGTYWSTSMIVYVSITKCGINVGKLC